jgi:hypothetical protein
MRSQCFARCSWYVARSTSRSSAFRCLAVDALSRNAFLRCQSRRILASHLGKALSRVLLSKRPSVTQLAPWCRLAFCARERPVFSRGWRPSSLLRLVAPGARRDGFGLASACRARLVSIRYRIAAARDGGTICAFRHLSIFSTSSGAKRISKRSLNMGDNVRN